MVNKSGHRGFGWGTSQRARYDQALHPDYAQVDERDLPSLLAFMAEYAKLLNFYDTSGVVTGDWQPFLEFDISFLLAQICVANVPKDAFSELLHIDQVEHEGSDTEDHNEGNTQLILKQIFQAATKINEWYQRAKRIADREQADNALKLTLEAMIQRDLKRYYQQIVEQPVWNKHWENLVVQQGVTFDTLWQTTKTAKKVWSENLLSIRNAFERALRNLRRLARIYLRDSLSHHPNHAPHTALLIAFVRLFSNAQEELNTYTRRHLEYYFYNILRLSRRISQSDVAHLSFTLAPHAKRHLLKAGTQLRAGKNANGEERLFATDKDLLINQASIAALKTVRIVYSDEQTDSALTPTKLITKVFAYPNADSEDGLGTPLKHPEQGWPTFGGDDSDLQAQVTQSPPHAELGFLIASPLLLLKEGQRTVTLTFRANDATYLRLQQWLKSYQSYIKTALGVVIENDLALLTDSCRIYLSGESGWFETTQIQFTGNLQAEPGLTLRIQLTPLEPAVVENLALAPIKENAAPLPMLKVLMNPHSRVCAYSFFKELAAQHILLAVSVQGLKNIEIGNHLGPVAANKPFPPFGIVPTIGSYLQLADRELSKKNLQNATLHLQWMNLPEGNDLAAYYQGYKTPFNNALFKARMSRYSQQAWEMINCEDGQSPYFSLFNPPSAARSSMYGTAQSAAKSIVRFKLNFSQRLPASLLNHSLSLGSPTDSNRDILPGSLRLELVEPQQAFGHALYPAELTAAILTNSQQHSKLKKANAVSLPNPPWVPMVKSLAIDYEACELIDLSADYAGQTDAAQMYSRFYHIAPFGYVEEVPGMTPEPVLHAEQGQLYIGLTGLNLPETLTLLFQTQERSPDEKYASKHERTCPKPVVVWRYLAQNVWKTLPPQRIIGDTTESLTHSGILTLQLPIDLNTDNTLMPSGLFWLSALVTENIEYVGNTVKIYTQAVTAKRVNDAEMTEGNLPALSIQSLVEKVAEIKTIIQPFATTGGRVAESAAQFEARVSERLKHKARAIQPSDYERLVLDAFPDIEQVKCIGPNNSRGYSGHTPLKPGHITLIVVPASKNGVSPATLRVPQSTLWEIADYLHPRTSSFVQEIQVRNPIYERLKVFAKVKFDVSQEALHDVMRLNQALNQFLAPWQAGTEALPIGYGGLKVENIASFIEQLPYVERLVDIAMLHLYQVENVHSSQTFWQEKWLERLDIAYPTAAWSVLTPVPQHDFVEIYTLDVDSFTHPVKHGIGNLVIGSDLIVSSAAHTQCKPSPKSVQQASSQKKFLLAIDIDKVAPYLPASSHELKN